MGAIMKSAELFGLLEEHGPRLRSHKFAPSSKDDDAPARVLQLSIETMLEELAPNLWENSLDRLVDFGHATGQDLEMAALGTEHELMHGESVATDMALMTGELFSEAVANRVKNSMGQRFPLPAGIGKGR